MKMKELVYTGAELNDRQLLHERAADVLGFPDYYGRNLDALYDLLSVWDGPLTVRITEPERAEGYGKKALAVFRDACRGRFRLIIG